jgi:hypothetical protein
MAKPKVSKVTREMNALLRSLAKFKGNTSAKVAVVIKYKEELGPEWCTRVLASLDDIIALFQHQKNALERDSVRPAAHKQMSGSS